MARDVAPRTLPADPTEDLHAATKQYVDDQIGGGAWPVQIDAGGYATILYVVGSLKIGVWYGTVGNSNVTIIADDANDVTKGLWFSSVAYLGAGWNYIRRRSFDEDQTYNMDDLGGPPSMCPGGPNEQLIYSGSHGLEIQVNADGSVRLVPTASGATFYVGLQLMWF
jgi:hypothetical protein